MPDVLAKDPSSQSNGKNIVHDDFINEKNYLLTVLNLNRRKIFLGLRVYHFPVNTFDNSTKVKQLENCEFCLEN